jgi:hypothetical protein
MIRATIMRETELITISIIKIKEEALETPIIETMIQMGEMAMLKTRITKIMPEKEILMTSTQDEEIPKMQENKICMILTIKMEISTILKIIMIQIIKMSL